MRQEIRGAEKAEKNVKPAMRPAARDDIVRQFRYYLVDQDKPARANRFLKAVENTIGKILRAPNRGAPRHLSNRALANLRSWRFRASRISGFTIWPNSTRCA